MPGPKDQKLENGKRIRREVLGDTHVDHAEATETELDTDFQHFINETVWGQVWSRTGIDRKTRHCVTIAILAALGRENELSMHLQATVNTGVSKEEVSELLHQVAIYAGVPVANSAFKIAKSVLGEQNASQNDK
jgi:4-carboxymuconolactone decarboxylase